MQANDAMRILGSAAAMGLLGGGSALAYNAISQPKLDEYGNVIESNDINPIAAALGGAVVGGLGGYGYGKINQPVARPVQGMNRGASPQPRQSPDIVEPEVMQTQKIPRQNATNPEVRQQNKSANQPIVQIISANPMEMQNPMSLPGIKTVVMQQPPKAPGQEMMEEALRLRELASRQGNPSVPYDVFGESDGYWEAQKKRA